MLSARRLAWLLAILVTACGSPGQSPDAATDAGIDDASTVDAGSDGGAPDSAVPCGTPVECAAIGEQRASDRLDALVASPAGLAAFLRDVPKGGDLHNHLSGAVYAETYLDWGLADGDCVNTSTHVAVNPAQCSAATQPVPAEGAFYEEIIRAWSMQDFVPGAESGHDHFFSTFGKFGAIAGAHRDDMLADVLTRAADENELYVETMFNLGRNIGTLAASTWSGSLTAADLSAFYDALIASPDFAAELAQDVNVVTGASESYRGVLGCSGAAPPAACDVIVRFIAQVSRTGANDMIFGQLVSAFEMGARTPAIVGLNLSSPEDDTAAINNYDLHMAMLDFLHQRYTLTGASPLHVTLHAGELTPEFLPPGSTANTFHIRAAVEVAHAERIGHGLDVLSETDPTGLMDQMRERGVLVEVCLSSNVQILEVSGAGHPLAEYLARGVPVALATDDQGVSRSSMAGEYARAVLDQGIDYRQLKGFARNSLEHAFLPGASLWTSLVDAEPVAACAPIADPPAGCDAFLESSERARAQWELEQRFLQFESAQ